MLNYSLIISAQDRDAQDTEYGHVHTVEYAHCPDPQRGASIIGLKYGMVNRIDELIYYEPAPTRTAKVWALLRFIF